MNAYEDTIRAFDDMIDWLDANPHTCTSQRGHSFSTDVNEYVRELNKRGEELGRILEHYLAEVRSRPQDNYVWRRFRDAMQRGCSFDIGVYNTYDKNAQAELRRVMIATRDEVIALEAGAPKLERKKPAQRVLPKPTEPESLTPEAEGVSKENVGYGWPAKLFVSLILAGLVAVLFRPVVYLVDPKTQWNQALTLAQIGTPITLFGIAIAVANMIRKP